ncbi:hypothetical protein LJC74_08560 [Eubacteriales bacterium OttesenSCG-928-A19]|nr:hypothetical protein [Eubacteriales bacterium OttesenSCG-928-A19]
MTRREFLKGTAGFVLALGVGFGTDRAVRAATTTASAVGAENAVGPLLVDGLTLSPTLDGADVHVNGQKAFVVNGTGYALLRGADGGHTMEQLVDIAGGVASAEATAVFFVTLARAGYLQNRLEVAIVESRA